MNNSSPLITIAWRNLWRNSRRTLLTALTVALGLALLLIFLGLGDGGHKQMIESAVRMGSGNVVFQSPGFHQLGGLELALEGARAREVSSWLDSQTNGFSIEQVVRRTFASALASSADGSSGVQLIGVEPELERFASRFVDKLSEGEFLDAQDRDLVLIGEGVARKLEVETGDKLVLMAQGAGTTDIQSRLMRVKGIIRTGQEEYDQVLVLLPLETSQDFLHLADRVHQVAVILRDFEQSGQLASAGRAAFPDIDVLSWEEALPELRDFIVIDDGGNYVFHVFLFLLIGFMVLNTLLMSVLERRREFALLDALGLSPLRRFVMVLLEAAFIAALASGMGLAIGYGVHHYLATEGLPLDIFNMENASVVGVAFDPIMYSYLTAGRVFQSIAAVFVLTLSLSLLPALRAARRGNVQILGNH